MKSILFPDLIVFTAYYEVTARFIIIMVSLLNHTTGRSLISCAILSGTVLIVSIVYPEPKQYHPSVWISAAYPLSVRLRGSEHYPRIIKIQRSVKTKV